MKETIKLMVILAIGFSLLGFLSNWLGMLGIIIFIVILYIFMKYFIEIEDDTKHKTKSLGG